MEHSLSDIQSNSVRMHETFHDTMFAMVQILSEHSRNTICTWLW